jgi:hypothetical protein
LLSCEISADLMSCACWLGADLLAHRREAFQLGARDRQTPATSLVELDLDRGLGITAYGMPREVRLVGHDAPPD